MEKDEIYSRDGNLIRATNQQTYISGVAFKNTVQFLPTLSRPSEEMLVEWPLHVVLLSDLLFLQDGHMYDKWGERMKYILYIIASAEWNNYKHCINSTLKESECEEYSVHTVQHINRYHIWYVLEIAYVVWSISAPYINIAYKCIFVSLCQKTKESNVHIYNNRLGVHQQ